MAGTLPAGTLAEAHKIDCEKKGKKRKRDYDTWCSQVVSNPCPNQARKGLTSLIRREVVLSSWYGRHSPFFSVLKYTGLWLTIEGWVDVTDIDNGKVFDTKPSHSHPPHPTTNTPPFHPSSILDSNPSLLPIPQQSPPHSLANCIHSKSVTNQQKEYE